MNTVSTAVEHLESADESVVLSVGTITELLDDADPRLAQLPELLRQLQEILTKIDQAIGGETPPFAGWKKSLTLLGSAIGSLMKVDPTVKDELQGDVIALQKTFSSNIGPLDKLATMLRTWLPHVRPAVDKHVTSATPMPDHVRAARKGIEDGEQLHKALTAKIEPTERLRKATTDGEADRPAD